MGSQSKTDSKTPPGKKGEIPPPLLSNRALLALGTTLFILASAGLKFITFFPVLPYLAIALVGLYIGIISRLIPLFPAPAIQKTRKPDDKETKACSVSIVIPAHNEEVVIRDTLLDMAEIKGPGLEILVMDDRSTDATARILEDTVKELHAGGHTHIRYHSRAAECVPGKSAVLNDALEMTSGDMIAVFDADARIRHDILDVLAPFLADPEISALQLRKTISNIEHSALTLSQELEYIFDAHLQSGRDAFDSAVELRGNGQFVRREAIHHIGGWNNITITDDLDLSTRLHAAGKRIRFSAEHAVYEQGVTGLRDLIKQRERWGEGSLRRYLDFIADLAASPHASWRVKADALLYKINFLIPVFIFLEMLVLIGWALLGPAAGAGESALTGLGWLALTLPLIWIVSLPGLAHSIAKAFGETPVKALPKALLASTYLLVLWFPMIVKTYLRVMLFPGGAFQWNKAARSENKKSIA